MNELTICSESGLNVIKPLIALLQMHIPDSWAGIRTYIRGTPRLVNPNIKAGTKAQKYTFFISIISLSFESLSRY